MTPQGSNGGRPPMHLYRGDLIFAVDLLADTEAEAAEKLARLSIAIRPYLAKTIRARRIGACELAIDTVDTVGDPSEV